MAPSDLNEEADRLGEQEKELRDKADEEQQQLDQEADDAAERARNGG